MSMTPPATNKSKPVNGQVLGGLWSEKGLNKNLVVKIRTVIEGNNEGGQGNQTYDVDTSKPSVESIFEDGEFTIESQYSTPFESSNPEGRMPNLMGMIQSGQISAAYFSLFAAVNDSTGLATAGAEAGAAVANATGMSDSVRGVLSDAESKLQGLSGRSNFTKLNSRQIFTSSNSVRITGSLIFQAWEDAKAEVEDPLQQLQRWASATELSSQSLIVGGLKDGFSESMFPSIIPPLVQVEYGGKTYSPMVIESVSAPITAPMNKNGDRIAVKVQVTLLSLTAWDAQNIINMRR
ncbi:hypothetical protein [Psychrobacter sp. W2-37-MNA-CIBAN-0211]|uniref:hypothetical protein n=1 Tax=Psychrobacter sp. W2-37-MNA-CIBAN-0211 TaxID=3140443 RepID=UPI00331723ED